ncbi:MAG: ribose 5-phosphate isomerase B [Pseudomonadota bacterium]|nr:ribose 5-phosphate isomerase B [Pseudomonadota bacterium]
MRVAISSDHAGFAMKADLISFLGEGAHMVIDLGPDSDASVDYPAYGAKLAAFVAAGKAERGIAICGSGIGIMIAVNREPECRCALASEPLSATLARSHNDANVLALGARLIGPEMARACVTAFLATDFLGGRHQRRVDMLAHPEQEPA